MNVGGSLGLPRLPSRLVGHANENNQSTKLLLQELWRALAMTRKVQAVAAGNLQLVRWV